MFHFLLMSRFYYTSNAKYILCTSVPVSTKPTSRPQICANIEGVMLVFILYYTPKHNRVSSSFLHFLQVFLSCEILFKKNLNCSSFRTAKVHATSGEIIKLDKELTYEDKNFFVHNKLAPEIYKVNLLWRVWEGNLRWNLAFCFIIHGGLSCAKLRYVFVLSFRHFKPDQFQSVNLLNLWWVVWLTHYIVKSHMQNLISVEWWLLLQRGRVYTMPRRLAKEVLGC